MSDVGDGAAQGTGATFADAPEMVVLPNDVDAVAEQLGLA